MDSSARRYLLDCARPYRMLDANHRCAKIKEGAMQRRKRRLGLLWWHRVNYTVVLKPKRGQKR
jgi:hypothetical protein